MKPSEQKLLDMLSNNDVTFFIPPYQRNYEWTDEQCRVFLEDVMKTCESNLEGIPAEHFFGTVTYFQAESVFGQPTKLVLIDGQQRITTTMLFLISLRDIFKDDALKSFIDSKYLKNNAVQGDVEYKIKLKQVETDWEAYKKIVLSEEVSDSEKNSAVYRNYRFFCNKLSDYREAGGDLNAIVEKGLSRFSVITVQLEPDKNAWENPQEIFESMNSLGKPLSLADLVRNYLLLGLAPEAQEDLYRRYWLHIEKVIPGKVSDFIRDYMQGYAKRAFVKSTENNYKELYSTFKDVFSVHDSSLLLPELSEYATIYSWLLGGGTGSKDIDRELKDLYSLGVTTAYSFLMCLLRAWKESLFVEEDIADILNVFKIYCLRRRVLGITSAENKNFPLLTKHIKTLAVAPDKKKSFFRILSQQEANLRLPNDVEMQRVLETMNFANFRYCKLYLSMIEEKITKSRPDQTDERLQIEHIMPQTLNDEWKATLGDDWETIHQELINTIGNLTLIRHNQELGNKPFSVKKNVYENNAGLQIAKTGITNREQWGKEEIQSRARWIIQFLLQDVLPIPDEMRRTNNYKIIEGSGRRSLSFQALQLIGEDISFCYDESIVAHVVSDKEVEFEGKRWRLSPLTSEIQKRRGVQNSSTAYQGARYWMYDGICLVDVM